MAADAETVQRVWIATLVGFAVVVAAVTLLLALILRAAREVEAGVSAIWTAGQQVANNTIHIALLDTTNHVVADIIGSARHIAGATAAMGAHAARCSGCPACVLDDSR